MARHALLRSTAAATAALTGFTIGGLALMGTAQAASHSSQRHQLKSASAWTKHAQPVAGLAAPGSVQVKVWLSPRDANGLTALAKSVSDPHSASYGHYLTEPQYQARFAPTKSDVDAVTAWLNSAGLHVDSVGADNHYVAVSGSQATIDAAFTAGVQQFKVNGQVVRGATSAITVPSALASHVLAVTGIDTLGHKVTPNSSGMGQDAGGNGQAGPADFGPPPGFVNAPPCSAYYGQKIAKTLPVFKGEHLPYAVCGYVPSQLRSVYGLSHTGLTGRGQTIAITDAYQSPTLLQDANRYAKRHGDNPFRPGQFSARSAPTDVSTDAACGGNGWYAEQSLDVEAEHGMAPDAKVVYYGAASCFDDDLLAQLAHAVSDNDASIVSNSWGEPTWVLVNGVKTPVIDDTLVAAYEAVFLQGAVQGIGFYFSSGDNGDEVAATGIKQTDWPASDPWVTSVGGTSLAVGRHGQRLFETGWGTYKWTLNAAHTAWTNDLGFLYGAGGGCSDWFTNKPFYQLFARTGCSGRAVPDIAADGDPNTGMLIGQTQDFSLPTKFGQGVHYGEYRIGGTSLASPLMAGINGAAQQGRSRIGFANPLIYLVGPFTAYDVTPQGDPGNVRVDYVNGLNAAGGTTASVRTFDQDSSLRTHRGWDDVSGVGTPTRQYDLAVHFIRLH